MRDTSMADRKIPDSRVRGVGETEGRGGTTLACEDTSRIGILM